MHTQTLARIAVPLLMVGALSTGFFALTHDDFTLGLGAVGFLVVAMLLWPTARPGKRPSAKTPTPSP